MTTVFTYEYMTASGPVSDESDLAASLWREGRAMRDAVADDFRRVPGVVVDVFDGGNLLQEPARVREAAGRSEYSLLIAPECGRILERLVGDVVQTGTTLLGPSPEAVAVCADKSALASVWNELGVRTPRTARVEEWTPDRFPVVAKARDGVGSDYLRRCDSSDEVEGFRLEMQAEHCHRPLVVQELAPGRPASVAFLIGPAETVPLAPTFQHLSADGRFRYEGGELPIPPDLAVRAVTLGRRAVGCVPGLFGYVGVDLALGNADDGSEDFAIEINPRLTTSYVGLRELADFNLAEMMLRVVRGEPAGDLRWKPGRVRFWPDGRVEYDARPV